MTDNTIITMNLTDVPDIELLDEGEHVLTVADAGIRKSKKEELYMNLRLVSNDNPNADDIYHVLMLPSGKDDRMDVKRLRYWKEFFESGGTMPEGGRFSGADLIGMQVTAIVDVEQDDKGNDRNRIKRFVVQA